MSSSRRTTQTPSRPGFIPSAPPSTAARGATQFARTPRFAVNPNTGAPSKTVEKDIENLQSSPFTRSSHSRFYSSAPPGLDELEDDEHFENDLNGGVNDSDEFDDLFATYKSRHGRSREGRHQYEEAHKPTLGTTTPPSRKRKRLLPKEASYEPDAIYISSSPSQSDSTVPSEKSVRPPHDEDDQGADEIAAGEEGIMLDSESSAPRPTPSHKISRFQPIEPTVFAPPPSSSRPSFIRPARPSRNSATGDIASLIPDTFSPSRRRGRGKEYLRGGMAETMVDWVLAMGQEEEVRNRQQLVRRGQCPRQAHEHETVVHVAELRRDEHERGLVIKGHNGLTYLLMGAPANKVTGGTEGSDVAIGSRVGLRKGMLSWNIDLEARQDAGQSDSGSQSSLAVSALWDLNPP